MQCRWSGAGIANTGAMRLANIRLDYAVRHHYPETVCADRGDAVSFYSDILKILEGKIND